MSEVRFDHIAIAVPRMADAPTVLVGALGGTPTGAGGPAGAYTWAQWGFAGGGRLEILEPLGEDGFLHRFLAARGPGVHHVTFRVPSLREACDRARPLATASLASTTRILAGPRPSCIPRRHSASSCSSAARADTQWGRVLLGRHGGAGGALVYRWPGSPMRLAVEVDPEAEEGPIAIEFASARAVGLPRTPHPVLGAVFRRGTA